MKKTNQKEKYTWKNTWINIIKINTKRYLIKTNKKVKIPKNWYQNLSEEDKQKKKKYQKNWYPNIWEEDIQKEKEYMREHRSNWFNIVLRKLRENKELKSVEVDTVTISIKDQVESFSNAEVYSDDDSEEDRWWEKMDVR